MDIDLKSIGYVYATRQQMEAVFGPSKNWLAHTPHGLVFIQPATSWPEPVKKKLEGLEWEVLGMDKAAHGWVKRQLDEYAMTSSASVKD